MQNYNATVANILATQFTSASCAADKEEEGKAQLVRLAAYEISQTDPNVGLLTKLTGNNVAGLTVDVLMDRTDGSAADCASSTPDGPGMVRITTPWTAYAMNDDPNWLARWRQPTAALAALPGPLPRVGAPVRPPEPGPTPPAGADTAVIVAKLNELLAAQAADTAAIIANGNANTQKIQEQLHQIVEDMEQTLKEVMAILLASRPEGEGAAVHLNSVLDGIRARQQARTAQATNARVMSLEGGFTQLKALVTSLAKALEAHLRS